MIALVGVKLLHRHIQFGLRAGNRITGMLQFLAANQVGAAQRYATVKVALRPRASSFQLNARLQLLAVDNGLAGLTDAAGRCQSALFQTLAAHRSHRA